MILANVAAAETLEKARTPLIYRVHEEPSKEKLFAFADFLRTIGVNFRQGPGDEARASSTASWRARKTARTRS